MRFTVLIALLLFVYGCRSTADKQLDDTIAAIKKEFAFKPLPAADAYDFLNNQYLHHLDTMQTGRKIFINPYQGNDFDDICASEIQLAKSRFSNKNVPNYAYPPPPKSPVFADTTLKWDLHRLINTSVVSDSTFFRQHAMMSLSTAKAWRRIYGNGYMCVSWPQYNALTRRLLIRECIFDHDACGTGKSRKFWYSRTSRGWELYGSSGF